MLSCDAAGGESRRPLHLRPVGPGPDGGALGGYSRIPSDQRESSSGATSSCTRRAPLGSRCRGHRPTRSDAVGRHRRRRDTDFTAKLTDVFPDGTARALNDGILRARYRSEQNDAGAADAGRADRDHDRHRRDEQPVQGRPPHPARRSRAATFRASIAIPTPVASFGEERASCGGPSRPILHDAKHPSRSILPVVPSATRHDTRRLAAAVVMEAVGGASGGWRWLSHSDAPSVNSPRHDRHAACRSCQRLWRSGARERRRSTLSRPDGIRFDAAYATAPLTLPAHVSMLSGTVAGRAQRADQRRVSRARQASRWSVSGSQSVGYRTRAFVGAGRSPPRAPAIDRGFETFDETWRVAAERRAGAVIERAIAWLRTAGEARRFSVGARLRSASAVRSAGAVTPRAATALRRRDRVRRRCVGVAAPAGGGAPALGGLGRIIVAADHGEGLGDHGEDESRRAAV